jgi:hypothetical protein
MKKTLLVTQFFEKISHSSKIWKQWLVAHIGQLAARFRAKQIVAHKIIT